LGESQRHKEKRSGIFELKRKKIVIKGGKEPREISSRSDKTSRNGAKNSETQTMELTRGSLKEKSRKKKTAKKKKN